MSNVTVPSMPARRMTSFFARAVFYGVVNGFMGDAVEMSSDAAGRNLHLAAELQVALEIPAFMDTV